MSGKDGARSGRDAGARSGRDVGAVGGAHAGPDMGDLMDELEELEDVVDDPHARDQLRDTIDTALEVQRRGGTFGRIIRGYDTEDVAESLLGSLLLGVPMAVEGGTLEAGAFIATHPLYFVGTIATTIALVVGVLYVADFQDVRIADPLLGFVPRRMVGVVTVSFGTAIALLTAWGMIDWADPWLSVCTAAVAFVPMSIGAALGDILPGS